MAKSKRKKWEFIHSGTGHKCGECVHFIPYTKDFLDHEKNPILGTCKFVTYKILRVQDACKNFQINLHI